MMSWMNDLGSWLGYSAFSGLLILSIGAVAVRICREPIYRIRIIQWTFLACLVVPIVQQLGITPWLAVEVPIAELPFANSNSDPMADSVESATPQLPLATAPVPEQVPVKAEWGERTEVNHPSAINRATNALSAAEQGAATIPWSLVLQRTIQSTYVLLVACFSLGWIVGFLRRRKIVCNAKPAGVRVRDILKSIAGPQADRVRLLMSDEITSPVMWGILRPTIVVPASHASLPESARLRWGLAHEWCHVLRSDFVTHSLAIATKFVCFFQPTYWWLKRELTLSQDFLADAFAARHGETEDYASFLVSLAKDQQPTIAPVGLGIHDGRSSLFKRIRRLLQSPSPLLQSMGKFPAVMIAAVALVVMTGFGSVRLASRAVNADEDSKPIEKQADEKQEAVKSDDKSDVQPITYEGRVINRDTEEPIAGATVQIKRELSNDPKTGKWILLEMTEHESDENGNYRFTLSPEQVAESSLYLEVNAHHPNYQSKGWSGYSHTMIRTNLEKGDPPFYQTIKLSPGEAITGIVTAPDGTPLPNVRLSSYSRGVPKKGEEDNFSFRGAFQDTETDAQGKFRMVVATPGDGVLWIYSPDYAAEAHRLRDKRGELGTYQLKEGVVLSGQVLDAKGHPVPGAGIGARRRGDGEEADEFLGANAVANGISSGATADDEGRFQLKPLPPGNYQIRITESARDPTSKTDNWFDRRKEKLQHVFSPMQVEIAADADPAPLRIQASPHVVIRGRFLNSKGEPRSGHEQHLFGQMNNSGYFGRSTRAGKDGWFEFLVPHGVKDVRINTMTNEHSSLRWKLKGMDDLTYGRQIPLGTLESDVDGLEIVRYKAPILLVKAVDEAGKPMEKFRISSKYSTPQVEIGNGEQVVYRDGDINFDDQADGRRRSSQMLPDAEVTIEPTKDGFKTKPQVVTLKEEETRELTFILTKDDSAPDDDTSSE